MQNLHQAAKIGNVANARLAIKSIFNENQDITSRRHLLGLKDAQQITPLHYAVKYNHIDIVRLLLDKGVDVNCNGENGTTPLHYATRYMRLEDDCSILQLLIYSGANVNAPDDLLATPLHYACLKGNIKAVKELLKSKDINVLATDRLHSTAIHNACMFGSIEIVDLLVDRGADVRSRDDAWVTPVHEACAAGHIKLLRHLLDVIQTQYGIAAIPTTLSAQNQEGQSPLHLAVLGSYLDVTKMLLEAGCETEQMMSGDETALHAAATTGHLAITSLLLKNGALIDVQNEVGRTPLHKAARFGKTKIVELLLQRGANVNVIDSHHESPLFLASSKSSNEETVQLLLDNGANIKQRNFEDRTPLHMATVDDNIETVKKLLTSKDFHKVISIADKDGNTALHLACAQGLEEVAKLLISADANVHKRNNFERTPLHLAAIHGKEEVIDEILEKNSSTINDVDRDGNAALHLAAQYGHVYVLEELLKCGASINDRNTSSMTALDCAAVAGQTSAAKCLLWGGASAMPEEGNQSSPLHRAAAHGHEATVKLLLEYCNIGATEETGRNSLDLAIDYNKKDAALAIIDHRDWKLAMRNRTFEEGKLQTPMRKLIIKMPDIAMHTFNRCMQEDPNRASDNPEFTINLTYEFLDDVYQKWPVDMVREETEKGKGKGQLMTADAVQSKLEKKETHTLTTMVKYKREDLLEHPLAKRLVRYKWNRFAAGIYYFKLALYTIFLIFLTGYILLTASLRAPYRSHDCTINLDKKGVYDIGTVVFVRLGKFIVFGLAVAHILFEVIQLLSQGLNYFALDNLIEWGVFSLAIINVVDDFIQFPQLATTVVCNKYQKGIGAMAIFFSWINFVLFIRKVPVLGIYIVMFLDVCITFFKFLAVFIFLILSFAFSFYVLLQDEKEIRGFHTWWKAIIKTSVMMTGELNFDDIFGGDQGREQPAAAWFIFCMFVVLMVIILMNLLVGLAVDDIQGVQRTASLTKAEMQIDLSLDAERILPRSFRKKFMAKDQLIYPNDPDLFGNEEVAIIQETLKSEKDPSEVLSSSVNGLKEKLWDLDTKVGHIHGHVQNLLDFDEKLEELKEILESMRDGNQKTEKSSQEQKPMVFVERDKKT